MAFPLEFEELEDCTAINSSYHSLSSHSIADTANLMANIISFILIMTLKEVQLLSPF